MLLSLRLPESVESRLDAEAHHQQCNRSQIAREAILEYLDSRERQRQMACLVAETNAVYARPELRAEAVTLSEDAIDDGLSEIMRREADSSSDPWWK